MQNERLQEIQNWITIPKSNLKHGATTGIFKAQLSKAVDLMEELITALKAAEQRIATTTVSYNSLGKINAEQALKIRELELEIRESK